MARLIELASDRRSVLAALDSDATASFESSIRFCHDGRSTLYCSFGRRAAAAATAGTGSTAAATAHPEAAGEPGELVVDTRAHAAGSCANLATQTVDSIASGASFVLISDHDPRGLHYMLDAERPGLASWQLLEDGPVRWQVRVTKNAVSV